MAQIIAIISSISTAIGIVKKLSSEDKDAKILSNITLMGYMIFICIVSFNPYQGVVVGLKTMGASYILGIMVILICKLWLRTEGVHKWVYIGVLVTLFTMVLDIYSYKEDSILDNIITLWAMFIIGVLILTFLAIIRKSRLGPLLIKMLIISYIIQIILYSITPPVTVMSVVVTGIMMILIGMIPGIILKIAYQHLNKDVKKMTIQEAMMYRIDEMALIIRECIAKTDNNKQINWRDVKSRAEPLLNGFKTDKDKLVAMANEDEQLAQIQIHIITVHEQLIIGYRGLLASMEKGDYDQILKFQGILLTSQDSMDKWNELLDARECH